MEYGNIGTTEKYLKACGVTLLLFFFGENHKLSRERVLEIIRKKDF